MERIGVHRGFKILAFAAAIFCSRAFAPTAAINGQIEGTVIDPSAATVAAPKSKSRIPGPASQPKRTRMTTGFFRFPLLPLGAYQVDITATGFAPYQQTGVTLSAGATATVNVKLGSGGKLASGSGDGRYAGIRSGADRRGRHVGSNQVSNLPLVRAILTTSFCSSRTSRAAAIPSSACRER